MNNTAILLFLLITSVVTVFARPEPIDSIFVEKSSVDNVDDAKGGVTKNLEQGGSLDLNPSPGGLRLTRNARPQYPSLVGQGGQQMGITGSSGSQPSGGRQGITTPEGGSRDGGSSRPQQQTDPNRKGAGGGKQRAGLPGVYW